MRRLRGNGRGHTRALLECKRGWQRVEREPQMGIYKRGKIWWVDYHDQQHQRMQESSYSSNRRDAQDLLNVRQSAVTRGVFRRPVKITFADYGKKYMEYAKANKRSWLRDEQMVKHLEEFFGAERQLTEIRPADIESYKLERRTKVTGSTVNRELAMLKHMFNLAIDWDHFQAVNPVRRVKFFREFTLNPRVLSPEEEKNLIRNAPPYMQDLIVFGLHTGLRSGEIFALRWSDVDMEKSILTILAQKTGKTRVVPLNTRGMKVLGAWEMNRKNDFVFYNHETGRRFVDLKAGFAIACKKAQIEGVSWHTLRHTFASRLIARGVDIVTVQQLLGHSTIAVTMRYTHTNLMSKTAAVAKLAESCDNFVTMHQNAAQKIVRFSQTPL
jgi:integrase